MTIISFLKYTLSWICLISMTVIPAVARNKVKLRETPVPITSVKEIHGFIGDRIKLNRETYLKNFPIEKYVEYIEQRNHTAWDWTKAEQHGKWLESAFLSALQSDDQELLDKANIMLNRIIDSQEPCGYLGATSAGYRSENRPVRGMDAYELYFVFHALISVYEQTGNIKALNSAEKLADYFLANFGSGKNEFWPSNLRSPENHRVRLSGISDFAGHSVHYGWEGTLLCDPIARLYEITGKNKYRDWSLWVVNNIDRWSGWDSFSRLDSVADGTLTVYDLQPYVHSHTFHMNFMGFLRLYKITGDESLLRKVVGAWDDIARRQMYITGGVSVAEHYEHGFVKPLSGNIVETCATMSWMQLTQTLLEITGEPKYADAIERLMLNHVFAGQDAATGSCRYHTAPNGTKPDGFFHGPDCCTASGHRVISLLPSFFYATSSDNGLIVNQYIPSQYDTDDFAMALIGDYPNNDTFDLIINRCKRSPRKLQLRIPEWTINPTVTINGIKIDNVQPGQYLTINNKLKEGDCIKVTFPKEYKWIKRENHSKTIPYVIEGSPEILYREEPDVNTPFALTYGPMVFSLDMVWNPQIHNDDVNILKDVCIQTETPIVRMESINKHITDPVVVKGFYKGSEVNFTMTPFASTGVWFRDSHAKPQPHSEVFSYGIWLLPTPSQTLVSHHIEPTVK